MNIVIKEANISEIKRIQELNGKLFEKEFEEFDDSLNVKWPFDKSGEEYFKDMISNHYVLVAYDEDKIVGYLAGSINVETTYNTTTIAELGNMFVEENYRNYGIGK